ncbi:general secretion pathway protein GspB [Hydrogenophaga sp. MI9]|uniref:general secretion pathway protein GspB n=1 Tax=Hydrogenophaga sp. MI9 TaxID=3453719 RepID=UPI003EEA803F
MSYILDALKRAHAERSHAASAGAPLSGAQAFALPSAPGSRRLPQGLLLGAVSLIVVAALATWWLRKEPAPAHTETPPAVMAVAPAPAPPPGAVPVDTAPAPQAPRPFVGPTQSAAPVLRPPPMPANATERAQTPTPAQSAARGAALMPIQGRPVGPGDAPPNAPPAEGASDATGTMAAGAPAAPGAGVPAAPPAPPPAMPAPLPVTRSPSTTTTTSGGPSGALASDTGLKVTGATYSENPAHRLLIVNGKVVKEGQEVEPGLVLEVISPRSAVFKRQGTRFNVNY